MKFTLEQFKELGDMCLDDFPIKTDKEEELLWIFNSLSTQIQGLAISQGFSDTEVREAIFKALIGRIGFSSPEQYYKSDVCKNYFENGKTIDLCQLIWRE